MVHFETSTRRGRLRRFSFRAWQVLGRLGDARELELATASEKPEEEAEAIQERWEAGAGGTIPNQGSRALSIQQACRGSFSKPICAKKFCSIFQALQVSRSSALLQTQHLQNFASYC